MIPIDIYNRVNSLSLRTETSCGGKDLLRKILNLKQTLPNCKILFIFPFDCKSTKFTDRVIIRLRRMYAHHICTAGLRTQQLKESIAIDGEWIIDATL